MIKFQNIFITPKEALYPLAAASHHPLSLAPGHHSSTFCLYGFAFSGDCIEMESFNCGLLVSDFFLEHDVFKVHPYCSMYQYFIPFHGWTVFTVWIDHILFINWPVNGGLLFHFLAITNNAMNFHVQVFVWTCIFISLGIVAQILIIMESEENRFYSLAFLENPLCSGH